MPSANSSSRSAWLPDFAGPLIVAPRSQPSSVSTSTTSPAAQTTGAPRSQLGVWQPSTCTRAVNVAAPSSQMAPGATCTTCRPVAGCSLKCSAPGGPHCSSAGPLSPAGPPPPSSPVSCAPPAASSTATSAAPAPAAAEGDDADDAEDAAEGNFFPLPLPLFFPIRSGQQQVEGQQQARPHVSTVGQTGGITQ